METLLTVPLATVLRPTRIDSIDVLRGLIIVIMALDHTRDFFHATAFTDDPLNLATTTPALFFTRWVTHFCAPTFALLSGTSIYLQSLRKTRSELSAFLLKRGLWLIVAEVLLSSPSVSFTLFNPITLTVFWSLGISMVCMAGLTWLPFRAILGIGLAIVLGHNVLDYWEQSPGFSSGFWWALVHGGNQRVFEYAPGYVLMVLYPFLPWLGLMMLGYCLGRLFEQPVWPLKRRQWLLALGFGTIGVFVVLRYLNLYGDPFPWSGQRDGLTTFFSFLKLHKYPPSLLYLCITVGPGLVALALLEPVRNRLTNVLKTYGRTAFFYYTIHWYVLHTLRMLIFFGAGHTMVEADEALKTIPMRFVLPGAGGYNLAVVYLIWLAVVVSFYPLCRWYDAYKTRHFIYSNMDAPHIVITTAQCPEDFRVAGELILAYVTWLGIDLSFQNFDKEISDLPAMYAEPTGGLLLAAVNDVAVGVAGIRPYGDTDCELKRMFVRAEYRNLGLGKQLLTAAVDLARRLGYAAIKLDTADFMQSAIGLYIAHGFVEILPYRYNPHAEARYFELKLR